MEDQQEVKKDDGRIKVLITCQGKSVPFLTNPYASLKVTVDNLKKMAQKNPQKYWNLPEMNNGGQRIAYQLGRKKEDVLEVFDELNNKREEMSLYDYQVKSGDQLVLTFKPVAG